MSRTTEAERFWTKVTKRPGDGCWLWTGALNADGYGNFRSERTQRAHAWSWIEEHGPVPDGLELDHLCGTRGCVRPSHCQPVTHRENVLRGNGVAGINARKTTCPQGHPYDATSRRGDGRVKRRCSRCANASARRRYALREPRVSS